MSAIEMRSARDEERATLLQFEASFFDDPASMRDVLAWNERKPLGALERVVAEIDGCVVGLGVVGSAELMGFGGETSQVRVYVCPEYRRRGIAAVLLRELERRATLRGRDVVVSLGSMSDAAITFFSRHGYEEIRRQPRWVVDVNGAPLDAFEDPSALAAALGVTLCSYAEARPRLGAGLESAVAVLHRRLVSDMPAPLRPARIGIAEYREMFLSRLLEDASILALKEDTVVGIALLDRVPERTAFARVIGAIGAYRAKRLPLALKLEAIRRLRALGYERLVIQDDQDNAPMRRILRGLGATETFDVLAFHKRLR
jgi:GNAT superfamily N-acetyltransferase